MDTKSGTFSVKSWQEKDIQIEGGIRLTHVNATMDYHGILEGEGMVEYLMFSPEGGSSTNFVGFERFTGLIGDRVGIAVFQHNGTFADGISKCKWQIVLGSGSQELTGITGNGSYGDEPAEGEVAPYKFNFEFANPPF